MATKTLLEEKEEGKVVNLKSYMLFWIGQTISQLGSSISNFTIIWWITITYNRPVFLGVLSFSGFIVGILSAAIFGVYVDKWNHKKILISTDSLSLLGTLILVSTFLMGNLTFFIILVVSTFQGLLTGLQGITTYALIPNLIPRESRSRINSINILGLGLSGTLGPLFGAILIGSFGLQNLDMILYIDAISFIIAVLTLIRLKMPKIESKEKKQKIPFIKSFKAGVKKLKETKGSMSHLVTPSAWNFFISPIFVLLPLIVINQEYYHSDAGLLSIFFIANQIAVILGSVIFSTIKIKTQYVKNLIVAVMFTIIGDGLIVYALYSVSIVYMIIGLAFLGFSLVYFNTIASTIWQTIIPKDYQGRVISVRRLFTRVPQALSYLLFTYLAEIYGYFEVVLICFFGFTILYFYILIFTDYRTLDEEHKDLLYGEEK